jgi:hypothetical protein
MVQISRRSTLSGVGTFAGLTALAGCVDDGSDRSNDADEPIRLPPGAGFEWSIELTESGVVADHSQLSARACPSLQPGRYRFVFWGANDLAVAFDYLG